MPLTLRPMKRLGAITKNAKMYQKRRTIRIVFFLAIITTCSYFDLNASPFHKTTVSLSGTLKEQERHVESHESRLSPYVSAILLPTVNRVKLVVGVTSGSRQPS